MKWWKNDVPGSVALAFPTEAVPYWTDESDTDISVDWNLQPKLCFTDWHYSHGTLLLLHRQTFVGSRPSARTPGTISHTCCCLPLPSLIHCNPNSAVATLIYPSVVTFVMRLKSIHCLTDPLQISSTYFYPLSPIYSGLCRFTFDCEDLRDNLPHMMKVTHAPFLLPVFPSSIFLLLLMHSFIFFPLHPFLPTTSFLDTLSFLLFTRHTFLHIPSFVLFLHFLSFFFPSRTFLYITSLFFLWYTLPSCIFLHIPFLISLISYSYLHSYPFLHITCVMTLLFIISLSYSFFDIHFLHLFSFMSIPSYP